MIMYESMNLELEHAGYVFFFLKPSESTISPELDTQAAEKVRTVVKFLVNVAHIGSLHILHVGSFFYSYLNLESTRC